MFDFRLAVCIHALLWRLGYGPDYDLYPISTGLSVNKKLLHVLPI